MNIKIREAQNDDLPQIRDIYAYYVLNTKISFAENDPNIHEIQETFNNVKTNNLPYLVAEIDNMIVGYAYAAPYRTRSAYRYTAEESVYVRHNFSGQGIGQLLLEKLIEKIMALNFKTIIAVVTGKIESPSYNFHEKCGFEQVGILKEVGFKQDQWIDTILMQKILR